MELDSKYAWLSVWGALLLCLLGGSVFASEASVVKPGKVTGGIEHAMPDWFKESFLEIQDDIDDALEQKRHVMLFFHLNQCPYCDRMLEDSFNNDPLKSFIQQHFDVIAINVKGAREVAFNEDITVTEMELAKTLKVQYTPTILFLNAKNKTVVRLNGYRTPEKFKRVLDYVKGGIYKQQTLVEYLEQTKDKTPPVSEYTFRTHPLFNSISDFSAIKTPLAVIFEDSHCDACNNFHDKVLQRKDVLSELNKFTVVRLDANSTEAIVDIDGNKTTIKEWAKKLKITYRPGSVLFDKGKEITRVDGRLYGFHYSVVLRYVADKHYEKYATYIPYLNIRTEELLKQGIDVDLSE